MRNGERRDNKSAKESLKHEDRFTILSAHPGVSALLYRIRSDATGGQPIRDNLATLGISLAMAHMQDKIVSTESAQAPFGLIPKPQLTTPIVLAIPRGGTAMGEGIAKATDSQCILTNDGKDKNPNEPLLPSVFPFGENIPEVILTDTVVASGDTVDKTIMALNQAAKIQNIVLITGIITPQGMEHLLQRHQNLSIVAGTIENNHSWIEKDGKRILFIHGIGDIGDLASK